MLYYVVELLTLFIKLWRKTGFEPAISGSCYIYRNLLCCVALCFTALCFIAEGIITRRFTKLSYFPRNLEAESIIVIVFFYRNSLCLKLYCVCRLTLVLLTVNFLLYIYPTYNSNHEGFIERRFLPIISYNKGCSSTHTILNLNRKEWAVVILPCNLLGTACALI